MTRQMLYEPLPASVLLNEFAALEFAALKRFAVVEVGGDLRAIGMLSRLAWAGCFASLTAL